MKRSAFYAALRARTSGAFGTSLTASQVAGMEAILDEAERRSTPLGHLAYILATTFHETAATMQPIHERGKRSYFNRYEPGTRIGKVLGNTTAGDGFRYRGRGFVQLTGRRNYALAAAKLPADLVANPDLALDLKLATRILFEGMDAGWFTGKDLDGAIDNLDENDKEDLREFVNARRIVNGSDQAAKIGAYALAFERALAKGGYVAKAAAADHAGDGAAEKVACRSPTLPSARPPAAAPPPSPRAPAAPQTPRQAAPAPATSLWASVLAIFLSLLGRKG
jgi:putative chitinase